MTIAGIAKAGVASTKYANGASGNGSGLSVADGSSQFHIRGTEDLGAGLKAEFQVDTRFRFDDNGAAPSSSPLATGNTYLGLTGGFGSIRAGKLDTHYCLGSDSHAARGTALQASSCALLGFVQTASANASVANASRSTNMIRYISPVMGGLTLQANYSTAWAGSEGAVGGSAGKGRAASGRADYANGPLTVGVSYWDATGEDQTSTAARTGQKASTFALGYNLGVATVGLTYDQSAQRAAAANAGFVDTKRNVVSVPVTVPMGSGTALLTYSKASDSKTAGVTNANTGATLLSVGYDYDLSPRTKLGVSYAKLDNKSAAAYNLYTQAALNGTPASATGQDPSQFYVGLRHAF